MSTAGTTTLGPEGPEVGAVGLGYLGLTLLGTSDVYGPLTGRALDALPTPVGGRY